MQKNKLLLFALFLSSISCLIAREPDARYRPKPSGGTEGIQYRAVCANSTAAIDMDINNVRARLLAGGDCWWNFSDGRYIVPKVEPGSGKLEVSSLYAGAVWLGGVDPGGSLKLACQDYRSDGRNDFWPGPLSTVGITESAECENWDRHFVVTGTVIRDAVKKYKEGTLNEANLNKELKKWPARGNPFFLAEAGFPLPNTPQGLASFFDNNDDGLFNPLDGDYPAIDIRGCPVDQFPDEMVFWIYNDHGGGAPHARTGGTAIQMEVQVQAFAYTTGDELNDMTFQRYKLINRATEDIDSCFFSMWADPDLGCSEDDFIGCDSASSLMYVYNQDAQDGNNGTSCTGGVPTYGNEVPILGIDYFRGPLDENGEEIGMSSFNFRNRQGAGTWPAKTYDPGAPQEYYNALNGRWNDNSELILGGDGTAASGTPTNYAFPDAPDDPTGWSMCTANLGFGDRRTLQTSGPFLLRPGAINELIIGVPWVPNITYPCPNLTDLFRADLLAQGLFDGCFKLLNGPEAPDLGFVEMNREVVAVLQNYNVPEVEYDLKKELPLNAPMNFTEAQKQYRYQGYIIYQLANPNVSTADYSNTDLARPVAQVDLRDSITKIYNWKESKNPLNPTQTIYAPQVFVDGAENKGIRHTFSFKEDLFSVSNSKGLINHKKYYYSIVAYAHNNYADFVPTPLPATGQAKPYLPGRLNIKIYTVIPRPVVDVALQSGYGSGVEITKVEGLGVGGNFLDLTDASREKALQSDFDGILTYKEGRGPFTVTIFNPFEVKDGDYEVRVKDNTPDNNTIDSDARWELVETASNTVVLSEYNLSRFNEQVVSQYGFTITLAQTEDAGARVDDTNGGIGLEVEYADPNNINWLSGQPDRSDPQINFQVTGALEADQDVDYKEGLGHIGEGWIVPYKLTNWRFGGATTPYITPAWMGSSQSICSHGTPQARRDSLKRLPNLDIVFTKDTSKWSRCVVVETANHYYVSPDLLSTFPPYFVNNNYVTEGPNMEPGQQASWRRMFDTRYSPSVGKNGQPDGSTGEEAIGKGWFPGYAIDVETGRRLNIFFGENSAYSSALKSTYTGRDMLFNPTDEYIADDPTVNDLPFAFRPFHNLLLGGQHMIYVTNETYDGCQFAHKQFTNPVLTEKRKAAKEIQWCGILVAAPGAKMLSAAEGLIPNDCTVKVRVQNPYQVLNNPSNDNEATNTKGYPYYRFKIENKGRKDLTDVQIDNALDSILIVPNPYYGYSQYEASRFANVVKVTNLPAKCTVTIYTVDGKFIRQYKRDETYSAYNQITPALEWDLKNNKGIPVSSGVYLFHIDAGALGDRTVKWFGINRRFDPAGL